MDQLHQLCDALTPDSQQFPKWNLKKKLKNLSRLDTWKQDSLVSPSELQFRSQLSLEPVDGGALDNQWHFSHFLSNKGVSKPPRENKKNNICNTMWEIMGIGAAK